ncbi:MAG: Crp/Fnr family transcriptional regulator [Alphaproteobacteria bacterium]|nr:Crp/Fnr family transcriptional regulator [Alphaproteobacteria bacterium]MBU1516091.1 Crp/Fnr family transcriptional regulator [Alphaproteobacteria bacterium]MBU2092694.1 Crp/Fnr family transcriptional regulator [Alphaproteobacteria bacterium]MBU2153781.1 Crp/Fnr family transcriptional regulator [Alphaproteobacteria bacterium]MBU2308409.1 Crp/Fnr family transcriptional regulator [Alphaproteobacteria bacterium]
MEPRHSDPWFSGLDPTRRAALLARARASRAPVGSRVYGIGDPPDGLWSVDEGEVRLMSYPALGMESVSLILGPGAWFGELSVIDGGPRPHDAVVAKPARLLHVPLAAIEQAAQQYPLLYRDLGTLICVRQRSALSFMGHSIAQPISVRLARTLAGAARASGGPELQVRQEDLAAMIGVSRQTVNRELKVLARAGAVALAYGRITILDVQRLRRGGPIVQAPP